MTDRQDDSQKRPNELFAAHYTNMLAYAYVRVKDETLAKDIVHDIFVELFRKPALCPLSEYELAYLHSAINNRSHTELIKKARRKDIYQKFQKQYQPEAERTPVQLLVTTEVLTRVRQLLLELPPQRREVAKLSLEGYSSHEIAVKLNIAEQTVRNVKKKALHFLAMRAIELGIFQSTMLLLILANGLA